MFKKKKIVLTSVLALAGVSLATVGFATWVVGLDKKDETLNVEAIVDTSTNKSIYLEATIENKPLIVAEKTIYPAEGNKKSDKDIITAEKVTEGKDPIYTVNADALKFKFTKLQYSVGLGATIPTKMTIELVESDTMNKLTADDCKMDGHYRIKQDGYTYLKFKKDITLNTDSYTKQKTPTGQTYDVYAIKETTYSFEWGTFFGNTAQGVEETTNLSPVNFYNAKSNAREETGNDLKAALFKDCEQANNELINMKNKLTGTLKVKVSIS